MRTIASIAALAMAPLLLAQQQNFDNVKMRLRPVQGNVYLLVGAGGNTTVQAGPEGILLVDTQFGPLVPRMVEEVRKLSDRPVQFVINTHVHPDHVGGNEELSKMIPDSGLEPMRIIAHENVLIRLTEQDDQTVGAVGLPHDEYYLPSKDIHFNGEAIYLFHEPNAHTDGDTVVLFRESDVVSTGDIFTPGRYPFIDIERGGSVKGLIEALNHILYLTVPAKTQEGGTYVIPGHGRICDEADVVEFRDMVVIIRDRIRDMIGKGMTLDQIKADKPTRDYDPAYVPENAFVTADRFVEAVYRSLMMEEAN